MSEERNQESAPAEGAASNLSSTSTPSVGRIHAPLPPPRTMPFGPGVPTPPPPARSSGMPSAAPPPPSRRPKPGSTPQSFAPPAAYAASDLDEIEASAVMEPSAPSQVSATALDSATDLSRPSASAPAHPVSASPVPVQAPSSVSTHSAPSVPAHSAPSVPGTPSLDQVFSADDEPESQDGAVLSAGRV
jgi:hypothetical protein